MALGRSVVVLAIMGIAGSAWAQDIPPPPFTPSTFKPPSLTLPELRLPSLPPSPPPPEPKKLETPYELRLDVDISLLALGISLWGGTSFVGGGSAPGPWCGGTGQVPCDASRVNVFDKLAVGLYDPHAALAANILTGVVPGALTLFDIFDTGITHWRGWLTDAVVISEAVVWSGAIQDITRRAVRRPRPFMYAPGLNPNNRDGPEADFSFFSGHTSNTFAMATAVAYTYTLRHPHGKFRALVWVLAMAGATTEPILRTLAGDHFPTDVMIGAFVGSAVGILFPALHRRRLPVRLIASSTLDATTVGVAGRW